MRRAFVRLAAAAGLTVSTLVSGLVLAAAPASAFSETITEYDVRFEVHSDGTIDVTETIMYDFGSTPRHGIEREIPIMEPIGDGRARSYEITDVVVESPTAPDDLDESDNGRLLTLRIGDPDQTITGAHEYQIGYRLHGALNAQSDWDELYWDAIGDQWSAPIERGTAEVVMADGGSGEIEKVACFTGGYGDDQQCAEATIVDEHTARFGQSEMSSREPLTIVVGFTKGAIDVPEPVLLDENNRLGGPLGELAAGVGPVPYVLGGALAIAGIGFAFAAYWRSGRDQRHAGTPLGLEPTPGEGLSGRTTLITPGSRPAVAPEFRPPDGVIPGLAGTLIDEVADTHDVSATIVDLAVRGWLRIEEVEDRAFWQGQDWRLTRLRQDTDGLTEMERDLLTGLFRTGEEVTLSELKYEFAPHLRGAKVALYQEVMRRGWFARRPDSVRAAWGVGGFALAVLGFGGTVWSLTGGQYGLAALGVGVLLGGLAMAGVSRAMPSRSPAGTAMAARVQGFRRYLATAEADQLRFEEGEDIFSRYLPYAMVFGVTERWAEVFEQLAAVRPEYRDGVHWYSGSSAGSFRHLGSSLSSFSSTAATQMSATRSSSSSGGSGFSGGSSGGGGGGGGGGSW